MIVGIGDGKPHFKSFGIEWLEKEVVEAFNGRGIRHICILGSSLMGVDPSKRLKIQRLGQQFNEDWIELPLLFHQH